MIRGKAALLLLISLAFTGCLAPSSGVSTPSESQQAIRYDAIGFLGDVWATESKFVLDGQLLGCSRDGVGPEGCENVSIELFSKNGAHLYSYKVGTLKGERNVSFTTTNIPFYVFVYSPDFWGHEQTSVDYLARLNNHNFTSYTVHSKNQQALPVDVSEQAEG